MRGTLLTGAVAAVSLTLLTGCAASVSGTASPAASAASPSTGAAPTGTGGGATPSCLTQDGCRPGTATPAGTPSTADLVCTSPSAASSSFDRVAGASFPGGRVAANGPAAALAALSATVAAEVRLCGLGVLVDVAAGYPADVSSVLAADAHTALGQLALLPPGLLCRDLKAAGWSARDAVDYWFYWGRPGQMDADLNGVPCETVWPDVARAMPYA